MSLIYKKLLKSKIYKLMSDSGKKMPKPPYENRIEGWWFKDEEIRSANKVGKMLTLDLDIGKACDLHCSFCFASTHSKDNKDYINKNTIRIKQILKEAAELGCKSIKIVGAGEPLLFPNLIEILEYCKKLKIIPIIFTGGHVFGDDNRAKNVFKKYGINSAKELVDKLYRLDCCFIVKFMSLNPKLHAKLVGANFDYIKYRDQGLLNLIERGFNYTKPTRLGVDCLLLKDNYREAVSLFSFFNQFNIFCVLNTSMDCGKTEYKLANPQVISKDKALKVSIDLYRYCLKNKIPFDKRISPYFCSPVCSQLNHGLFIGDDNIVKACPGGPDIAQYSKGKLKEIWKNNPFRKKYNEILGHECISRVGRTYHEDFEYRVRKAIKFIK